jgi:molybdate-binding protein
MMMEVYENSFVDDFKELTKENYDLMIRKQKIRIAHAALVNNKLHQVFKKKW